MLRDDPAATKWMRSLIGLVLGQDAAPEDVAPFLGGSPPEWMSQEEFDIRVVRMRDSLRTPDASVAMLKGYVARAISELQAHQGTIQEVADRRVQQAAAGAAVETTPEGTRLSNYILANEKGCDAALRRLELMRKPDRPGPKRGPKQPVAPAPVPVPDAVAPLLKPPSRPRCRPLTWRPCRRSRRRNRRRLTNRVG